MVFRGQGLTVSVGFWFQMALVRVPGHAGTDYRPRGSRKQETTAGQEGNRAKLEGAQCTCERS